MLLTLSVESLRSVTHMQNPTPNTLHLRQSLIQTFSRQSHSFAEDLGLRVGVLSMHAASFVEPRLRLAWGVIVITAMLQHHVYFLTYSFE